MTDDKSVDIVSDTTVLVFSESCLLSLVYHWLLFRHVLVQWHRKGGGALGAGAPPPLPYIFGSQSKEVICHMNTFKHKTYMPLEHSSPHIY